MRGMVMWLIAAVTALWLPSGADAVLSAQPTAACTQPIATVTVSERTYGLVALREFEGRVYLYAPEIRSTSGGFERFQLWVVEGIYGRPFVRSEGAMDSTAFDRLRRNGNIRTTPIAVAQSGQGQRVTIARQGFVLQPTVTVSPSGTDRVATRICRVR